MILSIITINYNNAEGLRKTLASVAAQTYHNIEHIIIDGGSSDGSVDVIKEYEQQLLHRTPYTIHLKWSSEKDNGIYHAMNKGIEIALGLREVDAFNRSTLCGDKNKGNRSELVEDKNNGISKASGDYIQILNSGDILAAADVTERMINHLLALSSSLSAENRPAIIYGNMIKKDYATGKVIGKSREVECSLRQYYSSTMNHDCCYIHRSVYEKYGLYDENLKIVSDWKWFLQTIGLGKIKPVYVDIDVTIFDTSGISETNLELRNKERRQVLEEILPPAVLADYDKHAFETQQIDRLRKHHLYGLVYFMERILFKLEKWKILK